MLRWFCLIVFAGQAAMADPVARVEQAAHASFDRLPAVVQVDQIAGRCGADLSVNQTVVYCTTSNQIFVSRAASDAHATPYQLAHVFGHAVQVQHGVADFALGQIRQRRSEEAMLRGLVTRQVECIAGFIIARAALSPLALETLFDEEPFTDSHWGRNPLRIGPRVSIGLQERDAWFARGQQGNLALCAPGEFKADLLLEALKP